MSGTPLRAAGAAVVAAGGLYRWMRLPARKELAPTDEEADAWQVQMPTIDTTLQMARLAMIVYYDDAADMVGKPIEGKLTQDLKFLKRLKDVGGEETEMWFYEAEGDTEAAITYSPKHNRCTLIFRGTESFWDAVADARFIKKQLPPDGAEDDHPGVRVHGGFRSQYYGKVTKDPCTDGKVPDELRAAPGEMVGKVLEDALFQKVEKVLKYAKDNSEAYPDLFVTGHSLGGALSVLCGIRLALKFPEHKVHVINFGCPKVGNAEFAKLVNTTSNLCIHRVAHKRDVITRVPNFEFNHVGHTIQIDEAPDVKPRAFKWHAGLYAMTSWSPLLGRATHHFMAGYLNALHSHKHAGVNSKGKKAWVSEYDTE